MAQARPSNQRNGRRIIVSPPVAVRAAGNPRPAPLQVRPSQPPLTWSVFAIEPDGTFARVLTGLGPQEAIDRARQWWAAEQDRGGDRDYAPGLYRPDHSLAEQEVRETARWIAAGRPKTWEVD